MNMQYFSTNWEDVSIRTDCSKVNIELSYRGVTFKGSFGHPGHSFSVGTEIALISQTISFSVRVKRNFDMRTDSTTSSFCSLA